MNVWNIPNQALNSTQFAIIATITPKDILWHL